MSEYTIRPGGSLKLKRGVAEGGIVKKKKKKSKTKTEILTTGKDRDAVRELLFQEDHEDIVPSGSARNSPPVPSSSSRKTEAEKRFEEVQKSRLQQRVARLATKTHKDRVNEFNAHLESLSEHHDIPKVGPG